MQANWKTEWKSYLAPFKESPGMAWAAFTQIWSQTSVVQSIINTIMTLAILYSTTLKDLYHIHWWIYLLILIGIILFVSSFMVMFGLGGIYRYGRRFIGTTNIEKKLDLIMKHLGIEDKE